MDDVVLNAAADEPIPPSEHLRRARNAGADGHLGAIDLCRLRCTCTTLRSHVWRTPTSRRATPAALKFFAGPSLDARFRSLTELNLSFCAGLRDTHLQNLQNPSAPLAALDCCHGVTDAGRWRRAAAARSSLLAVLDKQVTSSSALALSLRCPRLRRLSLSGCQKVDSTGVLALASRCRELVALDLTRLPRVDVALGAVVQANGGLAELRLYACSQYTDAPLIVLAAHSTPRCTRSTSPASPS